VGEGTYAADTPESYRESLLADLERKQFELDEVIARLCALSETPAFVRTFFAGEIARLNGEAERLQHELAEARARLANHFPNDRTLH
jgi:hypothetical protein